VPAVRATLAESPYVVVHHDPHALARSAAVRAAREADPLTRAHARSMSVADRLRAGFALSRAAARIRATRP